MAEPIKNLLLIDTNILVYAYDAEDVKKHFIASKLLEKCWKGQASYTLSIQNLAEFFFIIIEKVKNPLECDVAKQIVEDIIHSPHWNVIKYDAKTIVHASNIKLANKIHFWDALLIATMLENDVYTIYTENEKDFGKVKQISVVNPFKKV